MKSRVNTHIIETRSKDHIRKVINSTGMALFRDITERDYGIDAIIELFDDGSPTGKIALVQIKGTEKNIVPLKRSNAISCRISSSNACYKIDILAALKEAGYNTTRLRKEKLLSEGVIQSLRENKYIALQNISKICELLDCQPSDLLEYVKEGTVQEKA